MPPLKKNFSIMEPTMMNTKEVPKPRIKDGQLIFITNLQCCMELKKLKNQRDALLQALYQGVLTVKAGDKSVTYKSNKEMRDALALLDEEIALLEGRGKIKRILTYGRKGL